MRKPEIRKIIARLVATAVACLFCPGHAVSTAHGSGTALAVQEGQDTKQEPAKKKDQGEKATKNDEKGGGSAGGGTVTTKNDEKGGGSAGKGTITAKGIVKVEDDATFLVKGDQKWPVNNPKALSAYEGEYVKVTGKVDPDTHAIHVTSVVRELGSAKAAKTKKNETQEKD